MTTYPTYYEIWMKYGTDEDDLGPTPITPYWDTKKVHMLIKQLYLGEITIEQFKVEFN